MPGNPVCTLFIGNLDEKVDERMLYEILIQAGPVIDLYIPRDKETNRHKGYAFAEYETEDIAQYAIKLFTGLVCLNNRMLRFAIKSQKRVFPIWQFYNCSVNSYQISGQDKQNKLSPTQDNATASICPMPTLQSPLVFGKQMLPPSPYTPAERRSRHLPYLSPSSNYSAAYNSPGALKNGYNMENISPHSQQNIYNSKSGEAKRFDSCLSSVNSMGHRSSVYGSGYAYAHSSY